MKLSYNWLKDYLDCDLTPAEVAEAMTSIGIEVDEVTEQEEVPGGLAGVVVAQVMECVPHPDSDHLHVTRVDTGSGDWLTVVCGAPNVAAGQKVLLATIGTVLPGDFKIKKSKIRGVESFGMICADDELGLGEDHSGIRVLPEDAPVGMAAKEYLGLKTEAVIEYEITANRVDAASHIGVARDLYAWLRHNGRRCRLTCPDVSSYRPDEPDAPAIPVRVEDPSGAPRYIGTTIRDVKVAPSPQWLQQKLLSIGLRPINNVVDISNFILFELGQPLHTFDADKIRGGEIRVRRAVPGEKMVTLDGVERTLLPTDLVIADTQAPLCLAGVFGGEDSGVTERTTQVFLEAACFDPGSIRKTAKSQGLQTDASFRYERGVDPGMTQYAAMRAALLIREVAGGRICGPMQEVSSWDGQPRTVTLDYARVESLIGKKIGTPAIEGILDALGYTFLERFEGGSRVAVPTYMVDVSRECDVVEEILRIYGYNNIELPHRMQMAVSPSPSPDVEAVRNYISDFLAANGFVETMNNSLTRKTNYEGLSTFPADACVSIVNPLSSDLNVMRQTLILGGLEVVAYNVNRQVTTLRTFEYGSVYRHCAGGDPTVLAGYEEHTCFTMMMSGPTEKSWRVEWQKGSYYQLKGYLELLLRRYGIDLYTLDTDAAPADLFAEGLVYKLPGSGKVLAMMGTVQPALARRFDVRQPVFAAEIAWPVLLELIRRVKVKFQELPRFPEVRRDLALLLDESVSFADLRRCAFKTARKLLRQVTLFDVYRGDKIPAGKKQYALGFILQDTEKTLTDNEVESVMNKLLHSFAQAYGAVLR